MVGLDEPSEPRELRMFGLDELPDVGTSHEVASFHTTVGIIPVVAMVAVLALMF